MACIVYILQAKMRRSISREEKLTLPSITNPETASKKRASESRNFQAEMRAVHARGRGRAFSIF
jgi:hypothetical protein